MFGKITGLAAGYLIAWTVNTPQGRKAASQLGRAAMRQLGVMERQIINSLKGGIKQDETRDGTRSQDEVQDSA